MRLTKRIKRFLAAQSRNLCGRLAFASSEMYKSITRNLSVPHRRRKPSCDLTLLTMCGKEHLYLLRECLLSVHRSWTRLPRLVVVSDGTLGAKTISAVLEWWPGQKEISTKKETLEYHRDKGSDALVEFANRHVVGLKLANILRYSVQSPTLYCDSDFLWFRSQEELFRKKSRENTLVVMEDYQCSYGKNPELMGVSGLRNPPYINSGLVYANGELVDTCDLKPLIQVAANQPGFFSEQTIVATAARRLSASTWPTSEVACFEYDKHSFLPTYLGQAWVARHYVAPSRHLFWRDAFALRLGVSPTATGAPPESVASGGRA